jgi:hypothetical protein
VEYLVRTPALAPLVSIAPDHVDDLKARLREAYENGGTEADFARAGFLWGRKYASARIPDLFASKNDGLAVRSFDIYMRVFRGVYQHDRVACYDWFEGFITSPDALGLGPDQKNDLQLLLDNLALVSQQGNAAVAREKLDPAVQQSVLNQVKTNWNAAQLDFDGLAKPQKDFPPERKASVCYTGFAYFSEIERLPVSNRLHVLRALFGHA